MSNYKIEEKLFLSKAIISNVHSMRLKSRFTDNSDNETLVDESVELAVLMLEKRNLLFGESAKNNQSKKEIQEVNFENILETFGDLCSDLPQPTKITKQRQNAIFKILENYTLVDIYTVFKYVSKSDYLRGLKKGNTWKANFDWIIELNNFIKILEGNYKNTNPVNSPIEKEQTIGRTPISVIEKNYNTFLNAKYPSDGK